MKIVAILSFLSLSVLATVTKIADLTCTQLQTQTWRGIGSDSQLKKLITESSGTDVLRFFAEPNCIESLAQANFLDSIVAALDVLDIDTNNLDI